MFKIIKKYSKGLKFIVVLITLFLFFQAQLELTLPDYMSNIVTYGIQNKGIDYQVPKVMDEDTFKTILCFSEDKKYIESKYEYKSKSEVKKYDEIKLNKNQNGIYVLKNLKSVDNKKLVSSFGNSVIITEFLNKDPRIQAQVKKGIKIYQLPKQVLNKISEKADKKVEEYGDTTTMIAKSATIGNLYKSIGIDVSKIQLNYILTAGIKMLIIVLIIVLLDVLASYFVVLFATKIAYKLRNDIFDKVVNLSTKEIEKFSTASLITRTTNDVQQIQNAIMSSMRNIIFAPIMGIGAIIKVMHTSVDMVWIIALVVVIILSFIATILKICTPKFEKMQYLIDKLNLVVRESLSGMMVIRAFHNEKKEEEKFKKASEDVRKTQFFTNKYMGLMVPVISFIMNSVAIIIIYFGSHKIDAGTLEIGNMMAFIQYSMEIIMSFLMVSIVAAVLPRATVAGERCLEILSEKNDIIDGKVDNVANKGILEFKNVSFKFDDQDENTLSDISFKLDPQTPTAIIGSTGSGKSTILNLIIRLFDIKEGEILLDGINIKDYTLQELRNKIGIVFQNASLFKGDVASNIKYGSDISDDQVVEALKMACADFVLEDDKYIHYPISQKGSNVSGGQRQRLAIARTIAKKPEIYLFDDSFSALDFKTDAQVRANIEKVCKDDNSSFIIVGQRIASIMKYPQIIVLEEGKIVGIGSHKDLLKKCPIYQEIAKSQLSEEELSYE